MTVRRRRVGIGECGNPDEDSDGDLVADCDDTLAMYLTLFRTRMARQTATMFVTMTPIRTLIQEIADVVLQMWTLIVMAVGIWNGARSTKWAFS